MRIRHIGGIVDTMYRVTDGKALHRRIGGGRCIGIHAVGNHVTVPTVAQCIVGHHIGKRQGDTDAGYGHPEQHHAQTSVHSRMAHNVERHGKPPDGCQDQQCNS